jgi:hypothetical protein
MYHDFNGSTLLTSSEMSTAKQSGDLEINASANSERPSYQGGR